MCHCHNKYHIEKVEKKDLTEAIPSQSVVENQSQQPSITNESNQ
jgi:hypothetical protein